MNCADKDVLQAKKLQTINHYK